MSTATLIRSSAVSTAATPSTLQATPAIATANTVVRPRLKLATDEPRWAKVVLIGISYSFLALVLLVPLAAIFYEALRDGVATYLATFQDPKLYAAVRMTLLAAGISVPLNLVFGLAASWAIAKFEFRGRSVLISLIDLPFAVSPVISGLLFVLLFGANGWWGKWLMENNLQIIFATPGVIIATLFVTFPFVAREIIPLMQEQGRDEELAAISLGANGWETFWRVTLPNVKWAVIYGVILCNARAMGEFGAVSVVSGHRAATNTLPLHVEALYEDYHAVAAFAVASLLACLAIATLAAKSVAEWKLARDHRLALEPQKVEEENT